MTYFLDATINLSPRHFCSVGENKLTFTLFSDDETLKNCDSDSVSCVHNTRFLFWQHNKASLSSCKYRFYFSFCYFSPAKDPRRVKTLSTVLRINKAVITPFSMLMTNKGVSACDVCSIPSYKIGVHLFIFKESPRIK